MNVLWSIENNIFNDRGYNFACNLKHDNNIVGVAYRNTPYITALPMDLSGINMFGVNGVSMLLLDDMSGNVLDYSKNMVFVDTSSNDISGSIVDISGQYFYQAYNRFYTYDNNNKNDRISMCISGGYVFTAYHIKGQGIGYYDIIVEKYDLSGNLIWSNNGLSSVSNDINPTIGICNNGIVVVYQSSGFTDLSTNYVYAVNTLSRISISMLDINSGSIIWNIEDVNGNINTKNSNRNPYICINTDGIYLSHITNGNIVNNSGVVSSSGYNIDNYVINKIDFSGNCLWSVQGGQKGNFNNNCKICIDYSGDIVGCYESDGNSSGGIYNYGRVNIFKMDVCGNLLWNTQDSSFNPINADANNNVIGVDLSNNIYIAYNTIGNINGSSNVGGIDTVLASVDHSGNFIWAVQDATFNTTNQNILPSIDIYGYGDIYLGYNSKGVFGNGNIGGYYNIIIMKLNKS